MANFWLVGGAVRDGVMGKTPKDLDFAVEAESFDAMVKAVENIPGARIFQERPEFFTVRAMVPGIKAADFVLCRKEGAYTDGRRPDVVEPGTIDDDLLRRDFTVNAMARPFNMDTREAGGIYDPFGGLTDIRFKSLATTRDADVVFQEDALRIMRGVRFMVQLGFRMTWTVDTAVRRPENLKVLMNLPGERILQELQRMFGIDPKRSMMLLIEEFPEIFDIVLTKVGFMPTMRPAFKG